MILTNKTRLDAFGYRLDRLLSEFNFVLGGQLVIAASEGYDGKLDMSNPNDPVYAAWLAKEYTSESQEKKTEQVSEECDIEDKSDSTSIERLVESLEAICDTVITCNEVIEETVEAVLTEEVVVETSNEDEPLIRRSRRS